MTNKHLAIVLLIAWIAAIVLIVAIPSCVEAEQLDNAIFTCDVDNDCSELWKINPEESV